MKHRKDIIILVSSLAVLAILITIGFKTSSPKEAPILVTDEKGDLIPVSWPSQRIDDIKIKENDKYYEINAVYPKTQSDSISLYFKNYIEEQITQFKDDTSWINEIESDTNTKLTLDIKYDFIESSNAQNYVFSTYSYTGGAHGLQIRKTFSFNQEGQLLTISNLFKNGFDGLKTFSVLVQKELLNKEEVNPEWVKDGAAPKDENYKSFIVTDTGVKILFDPYQVAPYSAGNIDIAIPIKDFRDIANPLIFIEN